MGKSTEKNDKIVLYEDRVVVFIDILGFKKLIESSIDKAGNEIPEETKKIKYLLNLFSKIFEEHPDMETTKQVTQFSDSIVVSFHYTEPSQVFYTLLDILHLHLELINLGYVVRGSVCFGKLHHTSTLVFGPGIVKAYEFETQSAIFPRIVIEPKVFEVGEQYAISGHTKETEREHLNGLAIKDFDGHYFVDYFENAQGELDDPNLQWPDYLNSLRSIIEGGLKATNPSVRNKFLWMKEKFNLLIPKHKNEAFIKNVRKHLGEEFSDFYSELEEIE